jgi:hypothetical protein
MYDNLSLRNCDVFDEEFTDYGCGSYNSSAWEWEGLYEQYDFYEFEFEEESLEQMKKEIDWSNSMVFSDEQFKNEKLADFPPNIKLQKKKKEKQKYNEEKQKKKYIKKMKQQNRKKKRDEKIILSY